MLDTQQLARRRQLEDLRLQASQAARADSEMSENLSDQADAPAWFGDAWTSSSESSGTHRQRAMRRAIYELRHNISPCVEHRPDAHRLFRHCPYVAPHNSPLCYPDARFVRGPRSWLVEIGASLALL